MFRARPEGSRFTAAGLKYTLQASSLKRGTFVSRGLKLETRRKIIERKLPEEIDIDLDLNFNSRNPLNTSVAPSVTAVKVLDRDEVNLISRR